MAIKKTLLVVLVVGVMLVVGCLNSRDIVPTSPTPKTTTIIGLSNCDNLSDEIDSAWCYIKNAINKKDSGVCEGMSDSFSNDWVDLCYLWVAKEKGNISDCKKISEGKGIASCFTAIALKTGNTSICGEISDKYPIKYQCYLGLRESVDPHIIKDIFSCESDSDCVPASCCFPKECVNSKFAPDCTDAACAAVCEPYTMDCCDYCGCKCINNSCKALVNNGTFT